MPCISNNNPDCWVGIQDPKKRKQIQDRLAQRARRKRLREQDTNRMTSIRLQPQTAPRRDCSHTRSSSEEDGTIPGFGPSNAPVARPNQCQSHLPLVSAPKPLSIFTALFENGRILGIACGGSFPSKSRPVGPDIPISLRPTLLQMSTVHWQWIDRFPFPDTRDEIILNIGSIDEEEFLEDVFRMDCFTITPGCESWNPQGWSIEPEFQAKWGYLFPSFFPKSTPEIAF